MDNLLFHSLDGVGELGDLRLNNPYDYMPHPLVERAAQCVVDRLSTMPQFADELQGGKMLGVLIVRRADGVVGYLSAFSGLLSGRSLVEGFVPPIYDINAEYYRDEEARISQISVQIAAMECDPSFIELCERRIEMMHQHATDLERRRTELAEAKQRRATLRLANPDGEVLMELQRQSQHAKGEMRRFEQQCRTQQQLIDDEVAKRRAAIDNLVAERTSRSQELQRRMFSSYRVVNGRGEWRSLLDIFQELYGRLPPAGAGECAAPKLLHYALCNALEPLAIGEFWSGESPKGEVRRHGQFYGACRGKCFPILSFVLQGIELAEVVEVAAKSQMTIIYEDDAVAVVDKPSGMLSVAGRTVRYSVESEVERLFGGLMVHRLDQDTSGVMVVAKSRAAHKELQRQFAMHTISKRYVAEVDGVVSCDSGQIELPLSPNFEDRPRQMVDHAAGKPASTTYRVAVRTASQTRMHLWPHTGRTHQLRLHMAHLEGLNAPIVGDRLYGQSCAAGRLMLHAEELAFDHPTTGERVTFTSVAPF